MISPAPRLTHSARSASSSPSKARRIDVAEDVGVVLARLETIGEIGGPALRVAGIEPHVIDLDVGRGIERTADELLLDPQRPFDVQHVQPALEHVDEGAQFVVGGHQFAGLGDGFERELVFAGHFAGCS